MTPDEAAQELAKAIMDASLLWTGQDEEKNPSLKKARTLAGLLLNKSHEEIDNERIRKSSKTQGNASSARTSD
jgi:hypothetical protein